MLDDAARRAGVICVMHCARVSQGSWLDTSVEARLRLRNPQCLAVRVESGAVRDSAASYH